MRALPLLAAAALALTAGACAAPPAEKSAGGAESASGERDAARTGQPWWKLSQYSREAAFKPWVYGDVRPGKGLLSNDDGDGFVLYRKGEADSSDLTKPSKVRR